MPVYEYLCTECEHRFERVQRITERPVTRCPKCRGSVRKVFHPVGIIFKGPGFHVTDYPSGDRKEKTKKDEPAPAASKKDGKD
jgi:putative FmdB family regulatory protein